MSASPAVQWARGEDRPVIVTHMSGDSVTVTVTVTVTVYVTATVIFTKNCNCKCNCNTKWYCIC